MAQQYVYPSQSVTATNPSVGATGGAAPANATEIAGVAPGGLLVPVSVDSSGNVNVNTVSSTLPTGAATSALQTSGNASLTTIASNSATQATAANQTTGNNSLATIATNTTGASTAALQTSGNSSLTSIASNTSGMSVAQGSTTAGEVGRLVQGAATTSAPTYTTATTNPLSLTTSGSLRTSDASSSAQGSTTAGQTGFLELAAVTTAAPTYTTGQSSPLSLTTAGALRVDATGTTQPVSGTVTANQGTANTAANGWFVKTTDGTNTAAVKAASTAAAATDPALVVALSPNNNTLANSLLTKTTDGTNIAAVKAASTAAATTDPALVVALSPNNNVLTQPGRGTLTDNSGTTSATPSTATTLMAVNASRKYLFISNDSLSNTIWINFTTTAVASQPSIQLLPGAGFSMESGYVSTELVSVICTAASSPYTAKQG